MSYHPASHTKVPAEFRSNTPDRFEASEFVQELETPMRDGVLLRSDLYTPKGCDRAPLILVRVPYGRATPSMGYKQLGQFWARKGYACVVQDVRGKFSSDGTFEPLINERQDGYDTVEWMSRQPWCNGRVGMWGESYYGFTSLAAAVEAPPALVCIAPGDIATDRHKVWFRQGAFVMNTIGAWAIAMDAPGFADLSQVDWWHLPLVELATTAGHEGRFFRTLIDHVNDPEWFAARGLRDKLDRIKIPVLLWTGWYDNYTEQLLEDFEILQKVSPHPENVHLMAGPWDHEGTAGAADRAVCVKVPPTEEHRWTAYQMFFDRYLMQIDNGFGASGRVEYFTIGENRWQSSDAWPPNSMKAAPLFLRSNGVLSAVRPNGMEEPDRYSYDPTDPVADTLGRNCWALCTELGDRRNIGNRPDVVCYMGNALDKDVELTGPIKAVLHVESSAVDTDITVALVDVFPDGTANQIQDGIIRAAYREDEYHPSPITPGRVYEYVINMAATSYLVRAGHRIRVDVSSSCFNRYDRNTNTGERYGHAFRTEVAHQAIHHSMVYPSHILLPTVAG